MRCIGTHSFAVTFSRPAESSFRINSTCCRRFVHQMPSSLLALFRRCCRRVQADHFPYWEGSSRDQYDVSYFLTPLPQVFFWVLPHIQTTKCRQAILIGSSWWRASWISSDLINMISVIRIPLNQWHWLQNLKLAADGSFFWIAGTCLGHSSCDSHSLSVSIE